MNWRAPSHEDHPGHDARGCIASIKIVPAWSSAAHPGYSCSVTGGHCLPGPRCQQWRVEYANEQGGYDAVI